MKESNRCKKTEKGFQLLYWKLSNRRKFIRTLWLIPFAIIAIVLLVFTDMKTPVKIVLGFFIVLCEIVQLCITFYKMNKEKDR